MNKWRKWAGFLVLAAVVIAAILSAVLSQSEPVLPQATLSDGRVVQIRALTTGTNHVFGETQLQQFFRRILPAGWLGPKLPTLERHSDTSTLVVWIDIPAPAGTKASSYRPRFGRFFVHTDAGETFDTYRWLRTEKLTQSVLLPLSLHVYPRRDAAFDLRTTIEDEEISFRIPNPRPFDATVSAAPSPIPVTNHAGDIVLRHGTMTRFEWGSGPVLKFEYRRDGSNVTHEFDQWWTVTDLTGNRGWRVPTNEPIWLVELSRYRVAPTAWDPGRSFEFNLPDGVLAPTNSFSLRPTTGVGPVKLHHVWLGGPGTVIWHDDTIDHIDPPPADGKNQPYHASMTASRQQSLEWGRAEPWALINTDEFDGARFFLSVFLIDAQGRYAAGSRHSYLQWGNMNATMFSFPDLKDDPDRLTPPIKAQIVLQDIRHEQFPIDPAKLPRVDAPKE